MKRIAINDNWTIRLMRRNEFLTPEESLPVTLPATVYGALIEHAKMPDPFVGDNELAALPVMEGEFVFETRFTLDEEMLSADALTLIFHGVDTLGEIFLNGLALGETNNMHRTWVYDISAVASRENTLRVNLHSPTAYIANANRKVYAGGAAEAMEGFPHLRKAHCMFGWDWGARLPDAGLFRPVEIIAHNKADIHQVTLYQEHIKTGRGVHGYIIPEVKLHVTTEINVYEEGEPVTLGDAEALQAAGLSVVTGVISPDGAVYPMEEKKTGRIMDDESDRGVRQTVRIADPKLWWPNGYGAQPLYTVRVSLVDKSTGAELDVYERRIGLRILTVNQDPHPAGGKNFAFKVNGLPIFSMGANYVPEDNILSRVTPDRSRRLLTEAVKAGFNMIRVWGGGYYPDDAFYDLCDELGLIVWQDFMFACASYELDDAFEESILAEIADNVRRLRHHACLGLWCGNNEVETQTIDEAWKPSRKQKSDYIKIFEYLIPKLLAKEDPDTCYWPSSPSSGGNFDDPWAENVGDTHYWTVWHGNAPFTEYRKHRFRFVSEFGFQSFPCPDTIRTFADGEDLNIFSRVMELHQRNTAANGKLMFYLSANYLYPARFERVLYATQLLQADAIRYGVEHFRRHRGETMGALVWQFNDIAPMASWSCIDHCGHRKALYYALRRMFAPILLSIEEQGETDQKPWVNTQPIPVAYTARFHVANETEEVFRGRIRWKLADQNSRVLASGEEEITAMPYDGVWVSPMDLTECVPDFDPYTMHMTCVLDAGDQEKGSADTLFCAPKHYRFADPALTVRTEGKTVIVKAGAYARGVCILDGGHPAVCSDNFFNMEAGERRVQLEEAPTGPLSVISVYDIPRE